MKWNPDFYRLCSGALHQSSNLDKKKNRGKGEFFEKEPKTFGDAPKTERGLAFTEAAPNADPGAASELHALSEQ